MPLVTGPGQWIGNGYCVLQRDGFDGTNYTRTTAYVNTTGSASGVGILWTAYGTSLPPTYIPSGMVRLTSGTLVTLLFDPATQRTWGCNSKDKGKTWTIASYYSEVIPQLQIPPALTVLGDTAVACWVDSSDQCNFAQSSDAGLNWS